MKKPIPAHIRNLADKYYLEQCDRLGLPRPKPPKPPKAESDNEGRSSDRVWIHPDMQKRTRAVARERIDKDRKEGLSLEALWARGGL